MLGLAFHRLKQPNSNSQEKPMSARALSIFALGAVTIALAASVPQLAKSAQERMQLGALNANEGIYVDTKGFGVIKGAAKSDPTAQLTKLGATEVKAGAIIIRAGDKLYLVDADPKAKSLYSGWAQEAFEGATP
jgi:hypothetical protein